MPYLTTSIAYIIQSKITLNSIGKNQAKWRPRIWLDWFKHWRQSVLTFVHDPETCSMTIQSCLQFLYCDLCRWSNPWSSSIDQAYEFPIIECHATKMINIGIHKEVNLMWCISSPLTTLNTWFLSRAYNQHCQICRFGLKICWRFIKNLKRSPQFWWWIYKRRCYLLTTI